LNEGAAIIDAEKGEKPIGTSDRRKRNGSGDLVGLDERIGGLITDVTEDGEDN
jgi:hypothetical protein